MTKICLGNQYDETESHIEVLTAGSSGLEVRGGDLHQQAKTALKVKEVVPRSQAGSTIEGAMLSSSEERTEKVNAGRRGLLPGLIVLLSSPVLVLVYASSIPRLSPLLVPIVLLGAILVTYLVALVVAPNGRQSGLSLFGKVLHAAILFLAKRTSRPLNEGEKPCSS